MHMTKALFISSLGLMAAKASSSAGADTTTTTILTNHPYPTSSPSQLAAHNRQQNPHQRHHYSPHDHRHRHRRDNDDNKLGTYICTEADFKGDCWVAPLGPDGKQECQDWDVIRSIGPDMEIVCQMFEGGGCRDGKMVEAFVMWPGIKEVEADGVRSFRCGRGMLDL